MVLVLNSSGSVIALLHDWQTSKGATIEKMLAEMLGLSIYEAARPVEMYRCEYYKD